MAKRRRTDNTMAKRRTDNTIEKRTDNTIQWQKEGQTIQWKLEAKPTELYRSPDNRMILKQISKGDNHYLKKQQPF